MILCYTLVRVQNILVFTVNFQDSWKGEKEKALVHQADNGVEVLSEEHPLLCWAGDNDEERQKAEAEGAVAVCLRGSDTEMDLHASTLVCASSDVAAGVEARVIAALAEVAMKKGTPKTGHERLA